MTRVRSKRARSRRPKVIRPSEADATVLALVIGASVVATAGPPDRRRVVVETSSVESAREELAREAYIRPRVYDRKPSGWAEVRSPLQVWEERWHAWSARWDERNPKPRADAPERNAWNLKRDRESKAYQTRHPAPARLPYEEAEIGPLRKLHRTLTGSKS